METKICIKCKIEKPITEFRKCGKYIRSECKECAKKLLKIYRQENKEHLKEYQRKYNQENLERIKQYRKNYSKNYYQENKENIKNKSKEYYTKNKEICNMKNKIYVLNNKDKIKETRKQNYIKNKNKIQKYQKEYVNNRSKNDKIYKMKRQLRHFIHMSFIRANTIKNQKAEKIFGCNIDFLIDYLIKTYENNYKEEWNWEYIKNIHIDHIIPLATAKTEEEVINLCHYTNLQLLKAKDNLTKSDKLNWKLGSNND